MLNLHIKNNLLLSICVNKHLWSICALVLLSALFFLTVHVFFTYLRNPMAEEPSRLQSMGSLRVGHD